MFRRWLHLFLALAVLFGAVATGGVLAQDEPLPPPSVIDVWPLPGVELSGRDPLTLTFDQSMDKAATAAALSVVPAVAGETNWPDARTLVFTPDADWPQQTELQVIVSTAAQSASGVALDSAYQVMLDTVGPLLVGSVSPVEDSTAVAGDSHIVVTFNRPVVALGSTADMAALPSPITISPEVEGTGEWVNTSLYSFTPAESLAGSTTYTVDVTPGLQAVDGAMLAEGYRWSFQTLPPEILRVSPSQNQTGIALESDVTIAFSQPMDPASVEMAFSMASAGDDITGEFRWTEDDTEVSFTPAELLAMETTYTVSVDASARSANGAATLDSPYTWTFTTVPYPRVIETRPADGATEVDPTWLNPSIRFSVPVDFETVQDRISISPEPEDWAVTTNEWDRNHISIDFTPDEYTTYTITVDAGVQDLRGNVMEEPFSYSFTTGPIQPQAYPIINGSFMITSAEREDTRLAMMTSGAGAYWVDVFKVTAEDVSHAAPGNFDSYRGGVSFNETFSGDWPYWLREESLVRAVTQEFDTEGRQNIPEEVLLASEKGGKLAPGLYWLYVTTTAPPVYMNVPSFQFALAVVDTHITVKRGPESTVVWLTDLVTGEPVEGVDVNVYQGHESGDLPTIGAILATGVSGPDGALTLPLDLPVENDIVYIIAEGDGAYGAWYSNYAYELPEERAYLYTDRPIYRPGETVYFRGVARDRYDMDFSVPDAATVHITVRHPWQEAQVYAEMDVEVTAFGTFSGSFDIPTDHEIGETVIIADFGDGVSYQYGYLGEVWDSQGQTRVSFAVAEFRPPLFEVGVTAQSASIMQGDPVNAVAEASYYAGGGVSNAFGSYLLLGSATSFDYQGQGRYSFSDAGESYFSYETLATGELQTDEQGRVLIETSNTTAPTLRTMEITVEATIQDESAQPISSSTRVIAHPSSVYAGISANNIFARAGEPIAFEIITVTPDSVPVVGQSVDIEVYQLTWERVELTSRPGHYRWQQNRTLVATDAATTGEDGLTQYNYTPTGSGTYRVRVATRDTQERLHAASTTLYVTGNDTVFWGEPRAYVELQSDKASYVPGETATVLAPLPSDAAWTVLITAERAGVMVHDVVQVEGTTLLYDLPIEDAFVPTVYMTITAIRGATEDDANPGYATGEIRLAVEPVNQRLTIEAVPSVTLAEPQSEVTFTLSATDSDGEPVEAEIGVALVDKAVLALMPPNSTTLEATFYGQQRNYVVTDVAMSGLIDLLTDALFPLGRGGGGGGGEASAYIRDDFEYTPLWAPHVVTDENGQATVSVRLPDNLTTWQLDARAVTQATEVGQMTTEILSTLPLRVSPVAPRFFVAGDRAQVGVVVFNNTDDAQTVAVSLQATGVTLESDGTQTVTIASGARVRVDWTVVAEDVPGIDLVFSAMSESGHQDAARPELRTGPDDTIPVYVYSAPDTTGTGGILRDGGAATEAIALPPRLAGAGGELRLNLDPSLAATMTDTLDAAENFRCDCTEQTAGKLLQNIVTYNALQLGDRVDPSLEVRLVSEISEMLARLRESQREDGSWSWVEGAERGDPLVTAYVLLSLIEAQDAGFTPGRGSHFQPLGGHIAAARDYVRANLITPSRDVLPWQLNRQAFYLYVMGRGGYHDVSAMNALLAERLRMSYAARAYLLMAQSEAERAPDATLLNDLVSAALISANGAHWEEANPDWYNWGSDTRTTALVINALAGVDPDNALLPNAIRWLMQARQGDHWVTTQETTWSVLALSKWMEISGEMDADYAYEARLNGETLAEAQVAPDTVREGQAFDVPVASLLRDDVNRLTVTRTDGDGALYYSAWLDLTLPADEVDAISRGISVNREYYLKGDRNQRTTQAQVGDVITVRVTLTLEEDIPYFAFTDPLPAGTESIDPRLLTTSVMTQSPRLAMPLQSDPYWFFGWWWFDRTELRDAETRLFADFLPRGTYVYTYQVRATLAGEFKVMPAHAAAMYQPDVFGRTDGSIFTILPNPNAPLPDAPVDEEPEREAIG